MEKFDWQKEKERIKEEALIRHKKLSKLFVEDRLSFERERKRLIDELIDQARDEEQKKRLIELQAKWDKRMKGAGSKYNRYVLAQTFFWEHFNKVWNPAIQEFHATLKDNL